MSEAVTGPGEGKESFALRRKGVFKSIHDVLHTTGFGRRCSSRPIASHTPSAIHSAPVKCPGTAGTSFIRISSAETAMPNAAMARNPVRDSTMKNEIQAANQPSAAAIDPTSVTGPSKKSPGGNHGYDTSTTSVPDSNPVTTYGTICSVNKIDTNGVWLNAGLKFAGLPPCALISTSRKNTPSTEEVAQF